MPITPFKRARFVMTATDKQAFDEEYPALYDINWWAKLYFDCEIFPWQQYFYHHPAKDKMVVTT